MSLIQNTPTRIRQFLQQPQGRNFFIYALGAFFLKGISFFLIPLYTNLLTQAELGQYELLRNFGSITEIILSLGLLQTIYAEFFEKKQESKTKLLGTFLSIYLVISTTLYLVLAGTVFVAGEWAFPGIRFPLVLLVMATTYLNFFQVILITVLKLTFQAIRVSVLQVVLGCCNLALNLVLVLILKKGIEGILFSTFAITALCCAYGTWHFRKQVKAFKLTFSWSEAKHYIWLSLPYIPNTLVFWVMNSANRWILLYASDINAVGVYSAAARLTAVFESLVIEPFMSAYLPFVFTGFREGKFSQPLLLRAAGIPVAFVMMGLGLQWAGGYVIGSEFLGSLVLVLPLALSYGFNMLAQSSTLIMIFKRRVDWLLLCVGTGSLVSILLNFVLVPRFGAMGSALSTLAGNIAWAGLVIVVSTVMLSRLQKKQPDAGV